MGKIPRPRPDLQRPWTDAEYLQGFSGDKSIGANGAPDARRPEPRAWAHRPNGGLLSLGRDLLIVASPARNEIMEVGAVDRNRNAS